jgi:phosphopantothenoylcysteine synthetase/decarboxylase
VANDVNLERSVFGGEENRVSFLYRDGIVDEFDWMSKYSVGEEIVNYLTDD